MHEYSEELIAKFKIDAPNEKQAVDSVFARIPEEVRVELYRSTDSSGAFYAPYTTFLDMKSVWTPELGQLVLIDSVPAKDIVVYHCTSYVKDFDYQNEEIYIKTITLSKGYDLCLCTGRSSFRYDCSDFIYSDRHFDYSFGERIYWFVCYSSQDDRPELIRDKIVELFGDAAGERVFRELEESEFFAR